MTRKYTRHPRFTREEVLARIQEGPIRYGDLAGTWNDVVRKRLHTAVKGLVADGLVKTVSLDGTRHYAVAVWEMTDEMRLQAIVNRCRKVEGCMVWTGHVSPKRGPVVQFDRGSSPVPVRRAVWQIRRGALEARKTVRMLPTCDEACVEYSHMQLGGRGDLRRGRNITVLHRKNVAETHHKRAKLDWDAVRAIRTSNDTQRVLAARHGVSQAYISRIQRHLCWREQGGMFTALLKAAA